MAIPTIAWDESAPLGLSEKKQGASRIRELKTQIRELFEVDHHLETTNTPAYTGWSTFTGWHKKVTFYEQDSDQIASENTGVMYAKEVDSKAELFWYDEQDNVIQLTSKGNFVAGMKYEVRVYSGLSANIPTGWVVCDGNGSTPNLLDKFVRGINSRLTEPKTNSSPVSNNTRTLVTANLPSHTHTVNAESSHRHNLIFTYGAGSSTYLDSCDFDISKIGYFTGLIPSAGEHTHTINNTGDGRGYDNRPSFWEGIFIMKT